MMFQYHVFISRENKGGGHNMTQHNRHTVLQITYGTALHCTALNFTALHYTELYFTTIYIVNCTTKQCTVLHRTDTHCHAGHAGHAGHMGI